MDEQLTLEQLAIYLPYGLGCKYRGEDDCVELEGLDSTWADFDDGTSQLHQDVFPILRPLSDLTDAFIDEYYELFGGGFSTKTACINALRESILCWSINNLSYDVIILLAKHHFDIHGLIVKGLAIDINTLKI